MSGIAVVINKVDFDALKAELEEAKAKVLQFRQSMSTNGQRAKERIDELEALAQNQRHTLAKAARFISIFHEEDCMDQNEQFNPNEDCECGAVSRQNFIEEIRAVLEKT